MLSNKQFEGWRTYWKAEARDETRIFIKAYFGHDDPEFNLINGTKQVKLTHYFSNTLVHVENVSLPYVKDHWEADDVYFVAFSWRNIQTVDLRTLFMNRNFCSAIHALIDALSSVRPPNWWSREMETHNFALTNYDVMDFNVSSPFDADLLGNIAIENDDKIYFHDFEKVQWSKKGLMELHLFVHCYIHYLRGRFDLGEKVARDFVREFSNDQKCENFDQSISTVNLVLKDMDESRISSSEICKLRSLVNMQ
jgi:hypothetical protein